MDEIVGIGRWGVVIGLMIGLGACTTSKDVTRTQQQIRQVNDYRQVNTQVLSEAFDEYRKEDEEEVLYHLEQGMLTHFHQNWEQSSSHFQQAEQAIEENYRKSINRNLQSMLVNDLQLAYDGEAYEDVYINVVKALNYLHQDRLDEALVEVRRISHKLELINDRYKGLVSSLMQRDTAQAALKKVDERIEDVALLWEDNDQPPEVEQNSALGRFLAAVLYAKEGSSDDARVELQKLRTALEDQGQNGYLSALTEEGWFSEETGRAEPAPDPKTSLLVRATPLEGASLSPIHFQKEGRTLQSVDPDSMRELEGRYAVRLNEVPVASGDTVSLRSEGAGGGPLRLSIWSDSLQYRARLAPGETDTLVLGTPSVEPLRPTEREPVAIQQPSETTLTPTTLTYALTNEMSSGQEHYEMIRKLEPTTELRGDAWRAVERVEPAMERLGRGGARLDTMRLDASTLALLRHSRVQNEANRLAVRRETNAVVEEASQWQIEPIRIEHDGPLYGEGIGVELVLATRTMSVGDDFSLPVYVPSKQAVQNLEAQVTGMDTVAIPADTLEAYVVRMRAPDPTQGRATLYLRTSPPHHVVQARAQIPVQTGETTDTLTLRRTLTRIETSETGGPVLADQREPRPPSPPTNVPAISVSSAPGSTTADRSTNGGTTSPSRLTEPDAYNTLLLSFSGKAPRKVERQFQFNFEVRDEEFQLDFAIPALKSADTKVDRVRARVAGDTLRVPMVEDMQQVAQTMFDQQKSIIYTRAVVRSFLKAGATKGAEKLAEDKGGAGMAWLAQQAGEMASGYAAQADVRGWQTMPGMAYATVASLPAGTHEIIFEFLSEEGTVLRRRTRQVEVAGQRDLALAESLYLE